MVAASTALLPWITGYGTVLFQVVVLGAWSIVAAVTSTTFADQHHGPMWVVALLLNVTMFFLPGLAIFHLIRNQWPRLGAVGLSAWVVFYLLALFFLFPATDGP
jgi:hypothetical protein